MWSRDNRPGRIAFRGMELLPYIFPDRISEQVVILRVPVGNAYSAEFTGCGAFPVPRPGIRANAFIFHGVSPFVGVILSKLSGQILGITGLLQ